MSASCGGIGVMRCDAVSSVAPAESAHMCMFRVRCAESNIMNYN
jgi:hypothetical protein